MNHTIAALGLVLCATRLLYADPLNDFNASRLFHLTGEKEAVTLPFAFSTDATGGAGGIAYIKQGLLQPQTTFIGAIFGGSEQKVIVNERQTTARFKGAFAYFSRYRIPLSRQLYMTFLGVKSTLPKTTYYLNGTHRSNAADAIITPGDTDFGFVTLEYPLMETTRARTVAGLQYFYQHNSFDNDTAMHGLREWNSNGLRLYVDYDTTDDALDPSCGYRVRITYSRDFGWGESLQSWDFLEAKYNRYIPLPTFSWTRRNVFALSVWTGYSFSWDTQASQPLPGIDAHRPPMWEGARLGGMFRMRGYDTNRFNDKAVFYASVEYRATLTWNPFETITLLPVAVKRLQLVPFIEAGRVHRTWNAELLRDMHIDGGLSFRMTAAGVPVRFDIALSDEGTNLWAMVYHPFDF